RHLVVARGEPAARDRLGPAESGEGYLEAFGSRDPDTLTDDFGRFVFADLPSGEWTLVADRKGWWHESELAVTLAPGEQRVGLTLVVDEGLALEGVVLDEEEHALAGVTVDLYVAGEQGRRLYVYADERGRFAFHGLSPGDYTVVGGGWSQEFVEARREGIAAGTTDVRLVLERSVAQRVRVVDREGDPLPGSFVGVVDATGNSGGLNPCDDHGERTLHVSKRTPFALRAFANRLFDPNANFMDAFFLDENGNFVPEMSAERTGLTANTEVIELVIPGLP
ncbi:MAG: carboxypeptidase-like regulatory domain-containing protein, partial [Planctomycetota bacterium]